MDDFPNPIVIFLLILGLAFLPFLLVMATSYVKIIVVMSLVRNALGIQQIPPNIALHALAIVLTIYIMFPTGAEVFNTVNSMDREISLKDPAGLVEAFLVGSEPFKSFLSKHTNEEQTYFFLASARKIWPVEYHSDLTRDSIFVLLPSFTVSELASAFEVGFLLYLPFVAIDLIISNILLAMGMMMVSPMTISLPFKLLLFVLLDGWSRLIGGLILSYQ